YKSYMGTDVSDLVVEYAAQQIEQKKFRRFYVQWFGGEPMLNTPCIEYLSEKLVRLCGDQGVKYSASMISNGTCWPTHQSEIIDFTQRNHITSVQFTLDGLPPNHNKRRHYVRGYQEVSSFDALSRTISALVGHVALRLCIHCDPGNIKDVYALVDLLVERGWLYPGSGVFPYAAQIAPISESCDFLHKHKVSDAEFNSLSNEFRRYVARFVDPVEYAAIIFPESKKVLCSAVSENNIMVGPDGYVYKCSGEMGAHEKSHGHIRDLISRELSASPFRILPSANAYGSCANDYAGFDVFSQPTCSQCKYLPLCMGGCPKQQLEKYRLNENQENIDGFRQYWDESLQSLVVSYANLVLRNGTRDSEEAAESFYEYLQRPWQPTTHAQAS
ncbi:MAG: radical SAM protein, partial [Terriglobia bacterium]